MGMLNRRANGGSGGVWEREEKKEMGGWLGDMEWNGEDTYVLALRVLRRGGSMWKIMYKKLEMVGNGG